MPSENIGKRGGSENSDVMAVLVEVTWYDSMWSWTSWCRRRMNIYSAVALIRYVRVVRSIRRMRIALLLRS